jgi:hypothetical protein
MHLPAPNLWRDGRPQTITVPQTLQKPRPWRAGPITAYYLDQSATIQYSSRPCWYVWDWVGRSGPLHRPYHRSHLPCFTRERDPSNGQHRGSELYWRALSQSGEFQHWAEPGKSFVEVQSEVFEVFLRKLYIVYVDRWTCVHAGGECDLGWLGSIGFHSSHIEPLLNCE